MYDNYTISRCDAMEWLAKNLVEWPVEIIGGASEHIGQRLYQSWRFVNDMQNEMIFANGLSPCITEGDFYNFLHNYAGTEITRFGEDDEKKY